MKPHNESAAVDEAPEALGAQRKAWLKARSQKRMV